MISRGFLWPFIIVYRIVALLHKTIIGFIRAFFFGVLWSSNLIISGLSYVNKKNILRAEKNNLKKQQKMQIRALKKDAAIKALMIKKEAKIKNKKPKKEKIIKEVKEKPKKIEKPKKEKNYQRTSKLLVAMLTPFKLFYKYIYIIMFFICYRIYKLLKYIAIGFLLPIFVGYHNFQDYQQKQELKKLDRDLIKLSSLDEKDKKRITKKDKSLSSDSNPIYMKPINFIKYIFIGFYTSCYLVFRIIKLNILGVLFPFVFIYNLVMSIIGKIILSIQDKTLKTRNKAKLKQKTQHAKLIGDKIRKLTPEEIERNKKRDIKARLIAEREAKKRKKMAEFLVARERKEELEAKRKAEEIYFKRQAEYGKKHKQTKEKVEINPFVFFSNIPGNIRSYFASRFSNFAIVKNKQNRLALEREALLMSVDSPDAVKSKVKLFYIYVAKDPNGKIIRGQFEAQSKIEVHSYLLNEGYEVYSIKTNKWITLVYGKPSANKTRVKNSDLVFFLTQLSTYIKAGIPLVEALKILTRQYKRKAYQRIFKTMIYDLTMGENFAAAMEKQGVAFPKLLVNMVKAAEMTGELPEALDNMSDYYTEVEKTRKQMVTALIYPVMVVVLSVIVISFIILFVIPRFVEIYSSIDADRIPAITTFIINTSTFMQNNVISMIIAFMVAVVIFNYLYGNIRLFKTLIQWIIMHVPVFKNIVIYNEVTIFSKTFASLLSHNVFITDSMEILNSITDNEIYKMIILDTVNNLAKGERISESFKDHWAFPDPAYEMLVTGEKTGQLPEMMSKVSEYYQELHRNAVTRLKTVIEPALIVFLTFVVGGIVLAVVIPMFNMFSMIQQQ